MLLKYPPPTASKGFLSSTSGGLAQILVNIEKNLISNINQTVSASQRMITFYTNVSNIH